MREPQRDETPERPTVGVAIGKFLPYHRGHRHLLERASQNCDQLWVVLTHDSWYQIPPSVRQEWISEDFPEAEFAVIDQMRLRLASSDAPGWAAATTQAIGRQPDVAFSSEPEYGEWAELMGARHHVVDQKRVAVPICATLIRENGPEPYREYLAPRVFSWLRENPF